MKKLESFFATAIIVGGMFFPGASWSQPQPKILVNGGLLTSDSKPLIQDGRTLVPLRAISEAVGADVQFDSSTQKVSIRKKSKLVTLTLGQTNAQLDDKKLTLDVPAKSINGRTLVPLRFVGEALGAVVDYQSKQGIINISFSEQQNDQTPREYLNSIISNQKSQVTMEFKGKLDRVVDAPRQPGTPAKTFKIVNSFSGAVEGKKSHIKSAVSFPSLKGPDMKAESFYDGKTYYTKLANVGEWQGSFDMNQSQTQLDPLKLVSHLENIAGIVSFGNDTNWNGKYYRTLWIKLDPGKHKQQMKAVIDSLGNEISGEEKGSLKKLIDLTQEDMGYRLFIDAEVDLIKRADFSFNYTTTTFGQTLGEKNIGTLEMFNYGQPVTMPKVK